MDFLISGITSITPQQIVMYVIGAVLIWLAINKDLEPVLLLLLFIGIGAMIDFGPLLSNPKLFLFGAAAQFGIFAASVVASMSVSLVGFLMFGNLLRECGVLNNLSDTAQQVQTYPVRLLLLLQVELS